MTPCSASLRALLLLNFVYENLDFVDFGFRTLTHWFMVR
jgi:hypothetical protein